ncbi:PAAR domain-containing protein [Enterobacter bugandensis]|uniref:Pyocin large subunit n=1 Tax=Enterobacter bugandensis TaxID=881260 RepID=A0A822WYD0_9ENTR|nr:PAAR domain-containing protein [Enterobacter bugandensis]MCK7399003.1 PAAR domain-containing protein [Enterobacter bugandensis]MCK7434056.1 PAAR domain-containing protein [Enterobacter bugandensis]MED5641251.1 PAAR domain-containing protein [Enterobacter bugandensis]QCE27903.1 PAAR domain-containing protein [Enterobacter bugandensis]CZX68707.1 Pyocin large subunit [Enterobacter bugandensis]
MAIGHFLFRGDKTACGGRILEGCPDHQFFDKDMACEGHKVTCGKHPGYYRICGGLDSDDIHGKRVAGTLHSRSSCPCKSRFIPSINDTYEFSTKGANADTAQSHVVEFPGLPGPIDDPQTDNFAKACKPKDNPLLNGVYIWTEIKNAGHAFVSVHENNNIFLYTYGRYGRTNRLGFTGDGVLNFLQDEDARVYYRSELYEMSARVFRIDDADPVKTRAFFEGLWNSSKPSFQTSNMKATTRRRGRTIDGYDVTGRNCTTHSVEGIKYAGSRVFEHGYTSKTTQLPIDAEEDFTIPVSLQKFLITKGGDMSSMLVVEMTSTFKEQFPNSGNLQPFQETPGGKFQHLVADGAAIGDSLSPYSGGTVGGVLGGSYDNDE